MCMYLCIPMLSAADQYIIKELHIRGNLIYDNFYIPNFQKMLRIEYSRL